jgi:hypothetical protein
VHQVLDDRQAQPRAGVRPAPPAHPIETLEHQRQVGLGNAHAGVLDTHPDPVALGRGVDRYRAALPVVTDPVVDQVSEHLREAYRVAAQRRRRAGQPDRHAARRGERL